MLISAFDNDQPHRVGRAGIGALVLFLLVALALIAPASVFFWPDENRSAAIPVAETDVAAALDDIRATQQQMIGAMRSIKDGLAAERADLKTLSDQFSVLVEQTNKLQDTVVQIQRDNAGLEERLRATKRQIDQERTSANEQLKPVVARDEPIPAELPEKSQEHDMIPDMAGAIDPDLPSRIPLPPSRPRANLKRKPVILSAPIVSLSGRRGSSPPPR